MRFNRLICCILFLLFASCGTIVNGGPDMLTINSDPPGATVVMDGKDSGTTPLILPVPRSAGVERKDIILELAGYHPQKITLKAQVNGASFLNVFFGLVGIPMILIDLGSGNLTRWPTPEEGVSVDFVSKDVAKAPPVIVIPKPVPQQPNYGGGYRSGGSVYSDPKYE